MKTDTPEIATLENFIDEIVSLFHILQDFAARTHRESGLTASKRGVLRGLQKFGPQTVPQMARARPVSRQFIQRIVDQLQQSGLVEVVANPAHKRSNLVRLTPEGETLITCAMENEKKIFSTLRTDVPDTDLQFVVAVLREIKPAFAVQRCAPTNEKEN